MKEVDEDIFLKIRKDFSSFIVEKRNIEARWEDYLMQSPSVRRPIKIAINDPGDIYLIAARHTVMEHTQFPPYFLYYKGGLASFSGQDFVSNDFLIKKVQLLEDKDRGEVEKAIRDAFLVHGRFGEGPGETKEKRVICSVNANVRWGV
ncbi:MAG: hypothetical protein ACOY3X_01435 [Pseudomonadota bacterium]